MSDRIAMIRNAPLMRRPRAIAWILLGFVALGVAYCLTTPLFETPDEPAHFRYVQWIADGHGLPPLLVSADPWEQGEFHQPPLYYWVGALLTSPFDTGEAADLFERNPYAALGKPDSHGNKNAILHLGPDGPPSPGVRSAVLVLRAFGVLCGLGTVYLIYRMALLVLPGQETIAVGAAALAAFNPQFLFSSAAANNDGLVTLLATCVLYLAVQVALGKARPAVGALALGVLTGLAALGKISGIPLWLVVPLAHALRARRLESPHWWQDWLRPVQTSAAMAGLVSGWWYARNALLYGDPLGMQSYHDIYSVYGEPLSVVQAWKVLVGAFPSYWGVFGWMNVLAPNAFYVGARLLTATAVLGFVVWGLRNRYRARTLFRERSSAWLPLLAWTVVLLGLVFQWSRTITRTQGRLMFPAISSLSLLFAAGWAAWVAPACRRLWLGALVALLFAVACIVPSRVIAPAYALPERIQLDDVPAETQRLDASFGEELVLLGFELPQASVGAGESLYLRLYWLSRQKIYQDVVFFAHLSRPDDTLLGGMDTYPGAGMYPTRMWSVGEVVVDEYRIDVRSDVAGFGPGILRVGAYLMPGYEPLAVRDGQGQHIDHAPEIARLRVSPARAPDDEPAFAVDADYGDKILLRGYDLSSQRREPGVTWEIDLCWNTLEGLAEDYTVFLHLVDSRGHLVAQVDEPPQQGQYPTHLWEQGDMVRDVHSIHIPDDLAPGAYTLHVGLYLPQNGQRLLVLGADPPTDHVVLGPFDFS